MTEQPRAGVSTTAVRTTAKDKVQSGARWLGDKGTELSTLALPRLKAGLRQPWGKLIGGPTLAALFVGCAAIYCFGIGRDRYQTTSSFVVRQPLPPATSTTMVLGNLQSSSVLSSLEDGRYLQVYLKSNDVKNAVFPEQSTFLDQYAPKAPDLWSWISSDANQQQQLSFFQNQLQVIPQELSGAIVLTTSAFSAETSFELNQALLRQAQKFVNEVNQSISADQLAFAEKQVTFAQNRLTKASDALEAFQDRYGQLNPLAEQSATTSFITGLESRLVDLKVEELTGAVEEGVNEANEGHESHEQGTATLPDVEGVLQSDWKAQWQNYAQIYRSMPKMPIRASALILAQ